MYSPFGDIEQNLTILFHHLSLGIMRMKRRFETNRILDLKSSIQYLYFIKKKARSLLRIKENLRSRC